VSCPAVTTSSRPAASWFVLSLLAVVAGCAGSRSDAGGSGSSGSNLTAPPHVRVDGPCWIGGRITLDPSLRSQSPSDELANLSCDNVVLVLKTSEGSTKLVHADGVLAGGWGECRYQVTDVPPGPSTFSGKVSALSIPDYRYSLVSRVEFNAVKCGGSLASLNQTLDFVLTLSDVRGR
jgi:hypothetical protein